MAKPPKKEKTNRWELNSHPFTPYPITPETAHTAIKLLLSKENEILCQTLRSLTKFCEPLESVNREVTFNLDAIKYTLPHIDSTEINIKRFSLKLLAQMSQMPGGPEQIIDNPLNIRKVATILATSQDLFVLEFASLVLAECSKNPVGCDQLVLANMLGVLLNKLKDCVDPDVQKNCLQVLQNLLDDPVTGKEITKNPQFSWAPLFVLMQNQYPAIQQGTLLVIQQLLGRYNDQIVQKTFKTSTGIQDLCHMLESYEFRDMHILVLSVLKTFVVTEDNAAFFYQSGNVQKILDYLDLALPIMKAHVLSVLAEMSNTVNGRAALFETGTDLVFCHYLLGNTNEVIADSAYGVANMCKMWGSAVRMADTNIVDAITNTLEDETAGWFNTRMNCLLALTVLASIVNKVATAVVEHKNFNALRNINRKAKETPIEAQRLAMQCFLNLLNFSVSTKAMVNTEFISEVIRSLQRIDVQLKILSTKLLTGLAVEEVAKYILTKRKAESVIDENLRIEHVGLRTALCEYIVASVTEENADIYLGLGTIHYMIQCKKALYKVHAWESAIEALLRHHLSAKFAYTGRLDVTDISPEGFYVMKRLGDSFETFASLLEDAGHVKSVDPVLVVNFLPSNPDIVSAADIRSPYRNSHSKLSMHSPRVSMADDSNLRTYLLQLRIWFGSPSKSLQYLEYEDAHYEIRYREKCQEVSTSLKARAQVLGEYVAEQMCGLTQERDCSLPSVEIHLADLMLEMRQRVIGLGLVKCGAALERAILYKVLADRVGLPCSLHRTASAHAWVEVAVPEIDPEEEVADERYPAGLLRENYIVDLMDKPGKLIPLTSHEAKRICGPSCSPRYVSRPPPPVCICVPSSQPQQT